MPIYVWGLLLVVLLLLAGVYLAVRLNYQQKIQHSEFCPKCGGNKFHRVHRHTADRVLGIGLSTRRFRCANSNCGWEGVRQYYSRPKSWGKSEHRSKHTSS
jgi:predicted  nucleic acid-binding Zn-ribbon protein